MAHKRKPRKQGSAKPKRKAARATPVIPTEPEASTSSTTTSSANSDPEPASPRLLPQHQRLIDESAIDPEVARERGYVSIACRAELARLGFGTMQRRVPALLSPIYGVTGELVTYQLRPDAPRVGDSGKAIKYETPTKSHMSLDVPRRCKERRWLEDPSRPLFITEGARKADAAVSKGLCCIALLGVWNWRGTNDWGGKAALADWESIALNDREVYICFDSDVMTKAPVYLAMSRLKGFLELRKARVRVIYLPPGEGAVKVGLDDYFAAGNCVGSLLTLARDILIAAPASENGDLVPGVYFERDGRTYWNKPVGDGAIPVRLANFTARIVGEVAVDDGQAEQCEYEIEVILDERRKTITAPARSFGSINWAIEALGARAVVAAGFGLRERMREAVQLMSEGIVSRTVYVHTGWREIGGHQVFLHAGGAIGPDGPVSGVEVRLPSGLRGMTLLAPSTGAALQDDLDAVLEFTQLGPNWMTYPLLAAPFRAALGDVDFSLYLFGATDSYKTETATIVQSFFGTGFDARNLPGSWLSTGNSLEVLTFVAKDVIVTIDDFVPGGSRQDIQRQHREAERIFRSQGNRAGRGRLGADASLREGRAPRGMVLSTGEELPARHSARARMLVLEIGKGDVKTGKLTQCQQRLGSGCYARLMAAFLVFVAADYKKLKAALKERSLELRVLAQADDRHRRTAAIPAELQAAFELFLAFAVQRAGLDAARADSLRMECWTVLLDVASKQRKHQSASEPASLFLRLLNSAIASGQAHVADTEGKCPGSNAEALGWRIQQLAGSGGAEIPTYRAMGSRIGWVDQEDLYLDPDAALKAAQDMASDAERIPVSTTTLGKRLDEKGLLLTTDKEREHIPVRRMIEGRRASVLHLSLGVITGPAQSAQPAPAPTEDVAGAGGEPEDPAGDRRAAGHGDAENPTGSDLERPEGGDQGSDGPVGPEMREPSQPEFECATRDTAAEDVGPGARTESSASPGHILRDVEESNDRQSRSRSGRRGRGHDALDDHGFAREGGQGVGIDD